MDLTLDPGFENLREIIAWLGRDKLRPLGIECDRQGGPLDPKHPFFQEVLEQGLTAGFAGRMDEQRPKSKDPDKPRKTARRAVVMAEEAAYWDRGMATSLPGPGLGGPPVMMLGTESQQARFLEMFKQRDKPR